MTTRTYKSSNGDTYRVNEDGSVTRLQNKEGQRNNTQNNNYNYNNDSGGGNSGCVWGIIIAVVVGVILMFNGVFEDDDSEEPVYEEVVEDTTPNGEIKSLRVEHNVYQNGVKGMKVYSTFDVNNLNGQTIYGYVYIYWNDNTTPLHDAYGNNLSFSGYGVANYENSRFTDFCVFVPYTGLLLSPGYGTANLSFDFSIKTSSGDQLDRRNNTKFTMTEN